MTSKERYYIYHHADFDGLAGAVIFSRFLSFREGLPFESFTFIPVDYDLRGTWLSKKLKQPSAIIDFLFHPDGRWWFDHHATPFLMAASHLVSYRRTPTLYWNPRYLSCPSLIIAHLKKYFRTIARSLEREYSELIKWSDKIDAAQYDSPSDLGDFNNIYININRTLSLRHDVKYFRLIARYLFQNDISGLGLNKEYQILIAKAKRDYSRSMKSMSKRIHVKDGVGIHDQLDSKTPFQRYAAYILFPSISYRVATYKKNGEFAVSVNFNPWLKQKNLINLGLLCSRFGGGGRRDVGAVMTKSKKHARDLALTIARLLRDQPASQILIPMKETIRSSQGG